MSYVERSDEELLAFAREGVASAFAALLYRHGHEVLTLAQQDRDPIGAVVATYIRAMRELPNADPDDVRLWLLGHAAKEIDGEVEVPATPATAAATTSATGTRGADVGPPGAGDTGASTANGTSHSTTSTSGGVDAPPMETDDDLDEIWAELALRWPTGRIPRHLPSWAIWLITTVVLIALAILLPWAVLGASGDDEVIEELRASPVLDDLTLQEEVIEEDGEEEELPTFEFPDPPENNDQPAVEPEPETAPAPDPSPAPEPPPSTDADEDPDAGGTEDDGTTDGTDEGDAADDAAAESPDEDPDEADDDDGPVELPVDPPDDGTDD